MITYLTTETKQFSEHEVVDFRNTGNIINTLESIDYYVIIDNGNIDYFSLLSYSSVTRSDSPIAQVYKCTMAERQAELAKRLEWFHTNNSVYGDKKVLYYGI